MKKLLIVVSLALLSVQGAWAADKMLADRHVERGLKCESCHTTMPPKAVNTDGCLKCHVSYEKLAARTDKNDINPHDSHLEILIAALATTGIRNQFSPAMNVTNSQILRFLN